MTSALRDHVCQCKRVNRAVGFVPCALIVLLPGFSSPGRGIDGKPPRKPPRILPRPKPFTMTRMIRERKARGEKGFTLALSAIGINRSDAVRSGKIA